MTKIAIPTSDNVVDDHFGHCGDDEDKPIFIIPNMK
mgnify:CR=1 FL=1